MSISIPEKNILVIIIPRKRRVQRIPRKSRRLAVLQISPQNLIIDTLLTVHLRQLMRNTGLLHGIRHRHLRSRRSPLPSRNNNHAVSRLRTINSSRSSILQHLHRSNITRIDIIDIIHLHPVHDKKRVRTLAANRRGTPYTVSRRSTRLR